MELLQVKVIFYLLQSLALGNGIVYEFKLHCCSIWLSSTKTTPLMVVYICEYYAWFLQPSQFASERA